LGFLVRACITAALVASACGPVAEGATPAELSGRKIRVLATTGIVGDLVENVGGQRVEVTALMGPGIDPHLYKASERDVISLTESDVIFYNGLHLEARMADVLDRMSDRIATAAVTEGMDRARLLAPPEFEGNYDPHVWFDVELWSDAAREVARVLSELDPNSAGIYRDNLDSYLSVLDDLHDYVRMRAASLPEERRVLITSHDAFNYFGRAYGFEVAALQGISTVAEAGAADVRDLAEYIVERNIPALFIETSVPTRFLRAVQEAVRARGFDVGIGGELFSDAMGDPGTDEGTYPGMVRHNIDVIVDALAHESQSTGRPQWSRR
jgi:manganese/zinc/iron transport system substrate-binding protein